jgi:phosphohistidine swiveling domain-containing protein
LVAVRSSATVEDLAESSFAGQYRSILDVDASDVGAVLDAVRLVFASLWHRAPRMYRHALGVSDESAAMSVLLMQMVPARTAGVVFTVDPGGRPDAARVELVEGVGEPLVSGARTPQAWVLDRAGLDSTAPDEVCRALELALRVEELAGSPQDVEWAWDGTGLWLVQARPITTSATDVEGDGFDDQIGDEDLTTMGIGEMLPGVLPPLLWEINSHLVEEAFRQVLDGLALTSEDAPQPTHLIRRIRGRAALDFGRLRAMAEAMPGAAAEQLEEQYFGSRRRGRSAANPAAPERRHRHLIHDLRVLISGRHMTVEAATVNEAIAETERTMPGLAGLDDRELLRSRLALIDLAVRAMAAELGVAAVAAAAYRRVELMLLPHVGGTEAGRLAEASTSGLDLGSADPDASAALFAGPTWRELELEPPPPPIRPGDTTDAAVEALLAELDASESWPSEGVIGVLRSRALARAVSDARLHLERRERTKGSLLRLGGIVRAVHTEIGRRLCERGLLDEPSDVELLVTAELTSALDGSPPSPSAIARRRRFRLSYERERPLPVRFTGTPDVAAVDWPADGRLDGWPASAGRSIGTARVVRNPRTHIDPGDILVAEATDASWSPLFVRAGAIVLERGGPLSHAAILARELGVPAVLNVPGATRLLDGRTVTVDGDTGVVLTHDELASETPV